MAFEIIENTIYGFLNIVFLFIEKVNIMAKLTLEKCKEIASQYFYKKDLITNYYSVYKKIKKEKWDNVCFSHMRAAPSVHKIYSYNVCQQVVSNYNTLQEFRQKEPPVYNAIIRNRWNELLEKLSKGKNYPNGYTYEMCKNKASEFEYLKDFRVMAAPYYRRVLKCQWLDILDGLKRTSSNYKRLIYAYEFPILNKAYIGLTYNISNRNKEHHLRGTLFNFTKENGIKDFKPKILEDNIDYNIAGEREEFYMQEYIKKGWKLINKARAGSLGGDILKKEIIVCFDKVGNLLKKCEIKEMCDYAKIDKSLLRICLRGTNKSSHGFRFFTEKKWRDMGSPQKIDEWEAPNSVFPIAILDKNMNLIKKCETKKECKEFIGYTTISNNIYMLEKHLLLTAKEYKICYYEDYEKYVKNIYTIYDPKIPKNKKLFLVTEEEKKDKNFLKQFFVLKKWQEKRMEERHLKNAKDLTKRKSKRINYEKYFI